MLKTCLGGTVDPDLVIGVGNVVTSFSTLRDCKRQEGWTPGPRGSHPPSISPPQVSGHGYSPV